MAEVKKYVIYARVSERGSSWHERGIDSSIDAQIEDCKAYIKTHDKTGKVIETIFDEFISGGKVERPGLQKILGAIKSGQNEWNTLVVIDLDRLTRSISDASKILEIFHRNNLGLISVKQNWDFSTPIGKMMMWQCIVWSQYFREDAGDKTRRKMLHIARGGLWPGGIVPYGYKRRAKGDNLLVVDPVPAGHIHDIFRRYASGESPQEIATAYKGIVTKSNLVNRILKNKMYIGRMIYGEIDVIGQHEPIVELSLWNEVAARLPKKGSGTRPNARKYEYLLDGLIKCQCGKTMRPGGTKKRNGSRYNYYRCEDTINCPHRKSISAPEIENAIIGQIRNIPIEKATLTSIANDILQQRNGTEIALRKALETTAAALKAEHKKQKNIITAISTGLISEINAAMINTELNAVNSRVESLSAEKQNIENQLKSAASAMTSPSDIAEAWQNMASRILATATDRKMLRTLIQTHINEIRRTNDGYEIEYVISSPKSIGWYPGGVIIELLLVLDAVG